MLLPRVVWIRRPSVPISLQTPTFCICPSDVGADFSYVAASCNSAVPLLLLGQTVVAYAESGVAVEVAAADAAVAVAPLRQERCAMCWVGPYIIYFILAARQLSFLALFAASM